jgi:hypothetical protein
VDRIETKREAAIRPEIYWSSILAGSFIAMGTWLFLLALGAAIGGAGSNTWTALYTLISPIIALFFGSMVAARAGFPSRGEAVLHGVVIWGFTMSISSLLLSVFAPMQIAMQSAGFLWAVAGSILGSLLAAILGTTTAKASPHRQHVPREVNP